MAVDDVRSRISWGGFLGGHFLCPLHGCKFEAYEADASDYQLACVGGDAESSLICRVIWNGSHYNILRLA